ncbi:hypothetical protein QJS66_06255 [Kocuria rhizophila]|nr:hypothetical protein QJS66_06255 [Kocuria rhizophila]
MSYDQLNDLRRGAAPPKAKPDPSRGPCGARRRPNVPHMARA